MQPRGNVGKKDMKRQTPGNGTLYFPPFLAQYYRADVHNEIYRCRATNKAGTILSRSVHVHAVVRQEYDIRVDGKDVIIGNTAFLHCHIPEPVRDYVTVTSWYRGDEVLLPELSDVGWHLFGQEPLWNPSNNDKNQPRTPRESGAATLLPAPLHTTQGVPW
ncbi:hypothetical protein DMENIID0001_000430 [Sergentomyia squamirostris]